MTSFQAIVIGILLLAATGLLISSIVSAISFVLVVRRDLPISRSSALMLALEVVLLSFVCGMFVLDSAIDRLLDP